MEITIAFTERRSKEYRVPPVTGVSNSLKYYKGEMPSIPQDGYNYKVRPTMHNTLSFGGLSPDLVS